MIMVPAGEPLLLFRPRKKFWVLVTLWLGLLTTAGCDASSSHPSAGAGSGARVEKLKTNIGVDEARQLAEPISNTPGLSVDPAVAQTVGAGMGAPKGLQAKRLFDAPAGSNDERFERLEAALQKLRDDFDTVNPSINRLIAIEGEIQTLVDQLNVLVNNDGNPAPTAAASIPPVSRAAAEDMGEEFPEDLSVAESTPPVALVPPVNTLPPAPEPPPTATPPAPPTAQTSGDIIVAARVADHASSTRVVFETNANIPYTASVDQEKILIVTFVKGDVQSGLAATKLNSKLVKSIDVTPQGAGGVIIAMPLASIGKIVRQGVLTPDTSNPNYRIYIDISK